MILHWRVSIVIGCSIRLICLQLNTRTRTLHSRCGGIIITTTLLFFCISVSWLRWFDIFISLNKLSDSSFVNEENSWFDKSLLLNEPIRIEYRLVSSLQCKNDWPALASHALLMMEIHELKENAYMLAPFCSWISYVWKWIFSLTRLILLYARSESSLFHQHNHQQCKIHFNRIVTIWTENITKLILYNQISHFQAHRVQLPKTVNIYI